MFELPKLIRVTETNTSRYRNELDDGDTIELYNPICDRYEVVDHNDPRLLLFFHKAKNYESRRELPGGDIQPVFAGIILPSLREPIQIDRLTAKASRTEADPKKPANTAAGHGSRIERRTVGEPRIQIQRFPRTWIFPWDKPHDSKPPPIDFKEYQELLRLLLTESSRTDATRITPPIDPCFSSLSLPEYAAYVWKAAQQLRD